MPARHESLEDDLLLEAGLNRKLWSTKEGVGETSGQRPDLNFRKTIRQKKEVFFVRCGSLVRNFTGNLKPK
jgi:hypothetical protein